jgi:hypothetical protein
MSDAELDDGGDPLARAEELKERLAAERDLLPKNVLKKRRRQLAKLYAKLGQASGCFGCWRPPVPLASPPSLHARPMHVPLTLCTGAGAAPQAQASSAASHGEGEDGHDGSSMQASVLCAGPASVSTGPPLHAHPPHRAHAATAAATAAAGAAPGARTMPLGGGRGGPPPGGGGAGRGAPPLPGRAPPGPGWGAPGAGPDLSSVLRMLRAEMHAPAPTPRGAAHPKPAGGRPNGPAPAAAGAGHAEEGPQCGGPGGAPGGGEGPCEAGRAPAPSGSGGTAEGPGGFCRMDLSHQTTLISAGEGAGVVGCVVRVLGGVCVW